MAHTPPPTQPRWTTLAGLGAAVLGVHLWLLVGELPDGSPPPEATTATRVTPLQTSPIPGDETGSAAEAPAAPRPVTVSQVRWIAPAVAPTPPAARPAKAPQAVKARPKPVTVAAPEPEQPAPSTSAPPDVPAHAESTSPPSSAALAVAPMENDTPPTSPFTPADTVAQTPAEPPTGLDPTPGARSLPPAQVPGTTRLGYDVRGTIKGLGYSAEGTLEWTLTNGRYDARMTVRLPLLGSRVQTSTGRVDASGLLPERFADKARSERAAHVDHEQRRIRFSNNAPEAELQAGAQDRLSVFLQLAARLNAAPVAAGQLIEWQVIGTGSADVWRFRVGEEETLALPAGELRARRLVREGRGPHDTQVDLWLAPSLQHLPVRIRLEQSSGDQIDQRLSRMP